MFLLTILATLDPINGDLFMDLYTDHKKYLYAIALGYIENHEDAEDVVQDTYLKVYKNIEKFYDLERDEIIALLVIYTENTAKDYLRKRARSIQTIPLVYEDDGETLEYEIPDVGKTPEEIAVCKEMSDRLGVCIELLSDEQYQVLLLKYHYDMNYREIADALSISVSAVSSRINRAKETLRMMLGEDFNEQE